MTTFRLSAALCLVALLSACDKCGNFNINLPKVPGACADARPRA
jgi:hypothetical protein